MRDCTGTDWICRSARDWNCGRRSDRSACSGGSSLYDGNRSTPLPIGSIKTNLGHLETAAGVAGLLKAMLVLKHGEIPPSLHFSKPNPHIDFEKLKLRVPTQLEPFPNGTEERIAGVNSFGFGGANAHVILAEPPPNHQHEKISNVPRNRLWPVMLSARSEKSLRTSAANLSGWIKEHANANGISPVLPDLTYTLGVRRNHHQHRLTLVASDWTQLTKNWMRLRKTKTRRKFARLLPRAANMRHASVSS